VTTIKVGDYIHVGVPGFDFDGVRSGASVYRDDLGNVLRVSHEGVIVDIYSHAARGAVPSLDVEPSAASRHEWAPPLASYVEVTARSEADEKRYADPSCCGSCRSARSARPR
jgi:hypothetical protein